MVQKAGRFDFQSFQGTHLFARSVGNGKGVTGHLESSLGEGGYFLCVGSTLSKKYKNQKIKFFPALSLVLCVIFECLPSLCCLSAVLL